MSEETMTVRVEAEFVGEPDPADAHVPLRITVTNKSSVTISNVVAAPGEPLRHPFPGAAWPELASEIKAGMSVTAMLTVALPGDELPETVDVTVTYVADGETMTASTE